MDAKRAANRADGAAVRIQEYLNHADHDNHGDEVRRIGYGLHDLREALVALIVQKNHHKNWGREAGDHGIQADSERVSDDLREKRAAEEPNEMLKPYPFALLNPEHRHIIPKGDLRAIHWYIAENEEISQRGQQQNIDFPVCGYLSERVLCARR